MSAASPISSRWDILPRHPKEEAQLCRELGISGLLAAVLAGRCLAEPAAASKFIDPSLDDLHDPRLLPDYDLAVAAILGARERKEKIYVHGDYDVDGITSATLFARYLRKIGCDVDVHVPHRMKEGYGIHLDAVRQASDKGAKLFLTCDCGGSAHEQVQAARELGMQVVVTDHHSLGETLPEACAVINPHREDSQYPFDELSGVGVVFKLCEGITSEIGLDVSQYRRAYLDLAALGTIADVMPLVGENRLLAKFGLEELGRTKKIGIQQLKQVAELDGRVTAYHVGFVLGPRLNAAGRVDDAALALELLMSDDPAAARNLAVRIDEINRLRREEQERIIEEAIEMTLSEGKDQKSIIVVAKEGWHPGIVGIVAGRLVERFRRPVFVLSVDEETGVHKGSGRSIEKFDLASVIRAHPELLSGGGHAMAAGCSFPKENWEEVVKSLEIFAEERLSPEDFAITRRVDAEIEGGDLTLEAVQELSKLEPFGVSNPEPHFAARTVVVAEVKETRHPTVVQLLLRQGGKAFKGVSFDLKERLMAEPAGFTADILFKARVDEFRGSRTVKWNVEDFV